MDKPILDKKRLYKVAKIGDDTVEISNLDLYSEKVDELLMNGATVEGETF